MTIKIEEYKTMVLSTGHLNQNDVADLTRMTRTNMVMGRDTGYFVKLYTDDFQPNIATYGHTSPSFMVLVQYAFDNNFSMIEFDRDADTYPDLFPVFDW